MATFRVLATALFLIMPTIGSAAASITVRDAGELLSEFPSPTDPGKSWGRAALATQLDGRVHSGVLMLEGAASAKQGYEVRAVEVWVDEQLFGIAQGTTSWTFGLDTAHLVDGEHRLHVTAKASPRHAPDLVRTGLGPVVEFVTKNEPAHVVLFEKRVHFVGESHETWTYGLEQDLSDLRVTIETSEGVSRGALGAVTMHHVETLDSEEAPRLPRAWSTTFGLETGTVTVARPPLGVVSAPGYLVMSAHFVGQGVLTLRVEGVPVDVAPAEGGATIAYMPAWGKART